MRLLHSSIAELSIVQMQRHPILDGEAVNKALEASKDKAMSMFEDARNVRRLNGNGVAQFFGGLSARFAQYRTYRRTLDELDRLSDRELADLGISRQGLRAVAYRAAYDG